MEHKSSSKHIPTQQNIKQMHLKEIFLKALRSGGISRAQLRQEMRLSFPAVSALVDELLEHGILFEDGTLELAQRGRPRSMLRVNPKAFAVPVATMTPEGYRCSVFDCCGNPLESDFLPYAAQLPVRAPDMQALSQPLQDWLAGFCGKYPLEELVLTISGNFDDAGAVSSSALGFSTPAAFIQQLQDRLKMPVVVFNNADCYAYGEKYCQKLPEDFIAITIGRGVGAGIIRHGEVFSGGFLRAGEIGHISIDYNGKPCVCGSRGCLERYINTDQITQEACRLLQLPESTTDFGAVCQLYRQEEPQTVQLISEKARLLALGISNMLAMQPVAHIVIGGGIEQLGEGFLEVLRKHMKTTGLRKFMDRATVSYSRNATGGEALGAFWNYIDHYMNVQPIPKSE